MSRVSLRQALSQVFLVPVNSIHIAVLRHMDTSTIPGVHEVPLRRNKIASLVQGPQVTSLLIGQNSNLRLSHVKVHSPGLCL